MNSGSEKNDFENAIRCIKICMFTFLQRLNISNYRKYFPIFACSLDIFFENLNRLDIINMNNFVRFKNSKILIYLI